jgi:hypothetical protein
LRHACSSKVEVEQDALLFCLCGGLGDLVGDAVGQEEL